jgi:hypothetical protein
LNASRFNFFTRRRPWLVLAVLLYEAFFLNVLFPGHTRGAITLNGRETPACCAAHETKQSQKQAPTEKDKQNCAVCNFAARMSVPPAICVVMPELGLLQLLPIPPPVVAISADRSLPYLSRGPPSLA